MDFNGEYNAVCAAFEQAIGCGRSFDLVARAFRIGNRALKLYFVNGLISTDSAVKILGDLLTADANAYMTVTDAQSLAERFVPYVESETTTDMPTAVTALLSYSA